MHRNSSNSFREASYLNATKSGSQGGLLKPLSRFFEGMPDFKQAQVGRSQICGNKEQPQTSFLQHQTTYLVPILSTLI